MKTSAHFTWLLGAMGGSAMSAAMMSQWPDENPSAFVNGFTLCLGVMVVVVSGIMATRIDREGDK